MAGDTTAPPLQPTPPWSDLDANLLSRVVGFCALKDYTSCREVCLSWHAALPLPLLQTLSVLSAESPADPVSLAVCCLHPRRWWRFPRLGPHHTPKLINPGDSRCVGARDGWVALVSGNSGIRGRAVLFNPSTGDEILLGAPLYDPVYHPTIKIVFAPNPVKSDFTAVSLCPPARLAVQRTYGDAGGSPGTTVKDIDALLDGAVFVDVACGHDSRVYCLTADGRVYVLLIHRRCRSRFVVEVVAPHLSGHIDPFPPPYDDIAWLTDAKNLVLSDDGVLYQVWRRPAGEGAAVVDPAPHSGPARVHEGDVFVLRHDPTSWPAWTVVDDLGGNAFFIGMNDPAVVPGGDGGVRPNSVYYWDSVGDGEYEPVVYSVAAGSSVRWPAATGGISSPAWYFVPVISHGRRRSVEATHYDEKLTDYEEEDESEDRVPDRFRSKKTVNMLRSRLHPKLHDEELTDCEEEDDSEDGVPDRFLS